MDKLQNYFHCVAVPQPKDKVYKDECIFSFDNPETETGLYVCMKTFIGLGKDHVVAYSEKTGNKLFLHIHHIRKKEGTLLMPVDKEAEPEKKIARLAIGIEGGFSLDTSKTFIVEEHNSLVLLPEFEVFPLPNEQLPELIQQSISGILKAESALHVAEVEAAAQAWDGEIRQVTKYAEILQQLNNGVKIHPSGWKCFKCEKTDNLWMNLTDGRILCGRRQLDGSGGNNHALEYYNEKRYPLAVKLGTITADGKADVYSYEEDDMVIDPNLVQHLAHFGINVSKMEKTEKTMTELEIDYNQRAWEWSRLTESGSKLTPKFGQGYTGLRNLGNSCYMNSVMQVLMSVPSFMEKFYRNNKSFSEDCDYVQSPFNFNIQMEKLAHGLLSGKYSKAPDEGEPTDSDMDFIQPGISPLMFRTLMGRGHQEFSTKRQQDAMEFLEHILKLTTRNSVAAGDCGHCFRFEVEDKFICSVSNKVRYVRREDLYLPLPVPVEEAINKEEVNSYLRSKAEAQAKNIPFQPEEQMHYKIPFDVCLSKLVSPEEITAFSAAIQDLVPMQKITRLKTFPDYLILQLVKFGLSPDWQPLKYDVSIDVPDILDLSALRSCCLLDGEELMPDSSTERSTKEGPQVDESVVQQLIEMGFPPEACRKAVQVTGNWGSEAALDWIMEHMDDPDFSSSLAPPPEEKHNFIPNEDGVNMIMSMGFTMPQARLALRETGNNLERAADWIFSHQPQLDSLLENEIQTAEDGNLSGGRRRVPFTDGEPKYELVAFISHMGTSIFVGHYICHIKKDGEWTIFNDNKVCKSENPPKDLGYIYIYRRITNK